jgi:hypothetical protein
MSTEAQEQDRMEAHRLLEEAEAILRDLVGETSNEYADVAWSSVETAIEALQNMAAEIAGD